jgi:glycosyltransferase involved in cell wall biosynthesis
MTEGTMLSEGQDPVSGRPSLSIVVPIYNEAANLPRIIEEIERVAAGAGVPFEIVCVDDGSRDGSSALLARSGDHTVLTHATNRGYGAALKTGFHHARSSDYILFLDADNTYPPEEIASLMACIQASPDATMCIGSRMSSGSTDMDLSRKIGNSLYASLCRAFFRTDLSDVCSGMRIFRSELLERFPWDDLSDDLDFSPQLTSRCLRSGCKVIEVPIDYRERGGHSKLKIIEHGWKFLFSILRERRRGGEAGH